MSEDRRACANPDCEETIGKQIKSEFCFGCSSELNNDSLALLRDLDHVLALEAEFQAYCQENGLPNPHD